MRRAPPVGRTDNPTFAHELILQGDIVKITADRQPPIVARADIAMHQHFRAAPAPARPAGRADLPKARLRQRIWSGRLEDAVVTQVRSDDAGDLAAQRFGAAGIGRCGLVAIGRKGGNSDSKVVPIALIGDGEGQAFGIVLFLERRFHLTAFANRLAQVLVLGEQGAGGCEHQQCGGNQGHFHRDRFLSKRAPRIDFQAL